MRKLLLLAAVLVAMSVAVPGLAQDVPTDPDAPTGPPVEGPGTDAPADVPPEGPVAPPVTVDQATPVEGPPIEGPEADTPPGGPPVEGPGASDIPPGGPPAEGPEGPPVSVEEDTPVGGPPSEGPEARLHTPQALQEEFGESDAGRGILEEIRDRRAGIFQRLLGNDDDDEDVDQEIDQEAESGDVDQEIDISLSGDNSNQCVAILQAANTGNNQNAQGIAQDDSEAEDVELEGGGIIITPELVQDCRQIIQQTVVAGGRPGAARAQPVASRAAGLGLAARPGLAGPGVAGVRGASISPSRAVPASLGKAAPTGRLPRTGGIATASLLTLGIGALLIGGGLLARRLSR